MSKVFIKILAVLFFAVIFVNGQDSSEPRRFAVVTRPDGEIVRSSIEPGANMIMKAIKGRKFEIIGEGDQWLKIQTERGEGYIQKPSCKVVGEESNGWLILLVILLLAVGGGIYFFYSKKGLVTKENNSIL